jgi:hypothetical protein
MKRIATLAGLTAALIAPLVCTVVTHAGVPAAVPAGAIVAEDPDDVMGGATPKLPAFPKLAKKPGYLRGFVLDAAGKPVVGAKVLVSSSAFGGFRSGATGTTDARGYYEVKAPYGSARAYCAGYGKMYDGTYLSLSLHPADGQIDDFVSTAGHVENFALLTWGTVDPAKANQDPRYSGNYYGASFTVGYFLREEDDTSALPTNLPLNSTLEVTLTPDGPLADGSAGRPIVVRQKLDYAHSSYTQINDVPVGRYKIAVRLLTKDGKSEALKLRDNNQTGRKGGLTPKETLGEGTMLFLSGTGDPGVLRVPGGNMERMGILAERVTEDAK